MFVSCISVPFKTDSIVKMHRASGKILLIYTMRAEYRFARVFSSIFSIPDSAFNEIFPRTAMTVLTSVPVKSRLQTKF